jgi:hypothetical protein
MSISWHSSLILLDEIKLYRIGKTHYLIGSIV